MKINAALFLLMALALSCRRQIPRFIPAIRNHLISYKSLVRSGFQTDVDFDRWSAE